MGKKKPTLAANKDAFYRIHFLYQLKFMECLPFVQKRFVKPRQGYGKRFGPKLKKDPSIKRTVCKKCHSLLLPGVTCKVRTRAKRECHVIVTCLCCKKVKRFLSRKDYKLWSEQSNPLAINIPPATQPSKQKSSLKQEVSLPQANKKEAEMKETNEHSTQS